jgi:hypothetical protein
MRADVACRLVIKDTAAGATVGTAEETAAGTGSVPHLLQFPQRRCVLIIADADQGSH